MKTKSCVMRGAAIALLLAGFAWVGSALAVEPSALPKPAVNAQSCEQFEWNKDLIARYPWAIEACQEVIVVNGEKFARFEGHVVQQNRDGSVKTQFVNREGKHTKAWGYMNLMPASEQHAAIGGEQTHFRDLPRNQVLSFYAPEKVLGIAETPGAPVATIVEAPPIERGVALGEGVLPRTAGPLPLIALAGIASLLGGLGLALRRRQSKF